MKSAIQVGRRDEHKRRDVGIPFVSEGRLSCQKRSKTLRFPVGQDQRMLECFLGAVRSSPPPTLSVAKEHAGEGLDLDKEDPSR